MEGYTNRFRGWFEACEHNRDEKEIKRICGFKFDKIDNLKTKKYGNTTYIYEDEHGHS